jgi:hypothetical protein
MRGLDDLMAGSLEDHPQHHARRRVIIHNQNRAQPWCLPLATSLTGARKRWIGAEVIPERIRAPA